MKIADILSAAPGGGSLLHVPGFPVTAALPANVRDYHAMGKLQQWAVGSLTPGMTWRDGVAISERLFPVQMPVDIFDLFLHETGHWWQLWRRMGPNDFPATYGWQALVSRVRVGSAHLHADHIVEREVIDWTNRMMVEINAMLRVSQPVTFDVTGWLSIHAPAMR